MLYLSNAPLTHKENGYIHERYFGCGKPKKTNKKNKNKKQANKQTTTTKKQQQNGVENYTVIILRGPHQRRGLVQRR